MASTYGVLGIMSRKYAHKIPFVVKINHNEFLSMPNRFDQTMFGTIKSAWDMGAVAVGATIYWGQHVFGSSRPKSASISSLRQTSRTRRVESSTRMQSAKKVLLHRNR